MALIQGSESVETNRKKNYDQIRIMFTKKKMRTLFNILYMILVFIKCEFYWHYFPSSFPFYLSISWRSPIFQLVYQTLFRFSNMHTFKKLDTISIHHIWDIKGSTKYQQSLNSNSMYILGVSSQFNKFPNTYQFIFYHGPLNCIPTHAHRQTHMRCAKFVVTESE